MPKIEIEIDDRVIPEGYEAVRFGVGDVNAMAPNGHWDGDNVKAVGLIIRKKWTPPAWMKEGSWLYPHGNMWFLSDVEPRRRSEVDFVSDGKYTVIHACLFNDFIPPSERRPHQVRHASR